MRLVLLFGCALLVGCLAEYPALSSSTARTEAIDDYNRGLEKRDPVAAAIQYTPVPVEALLSGLSKTAGMNATNPQPKKNNPRLQGALPLHVKSLAESLTTDGTVPPIPVRLDGASPLSAKHLAHACERRVRGLPWDKYEASLTVFESAAKATNLTDVQVPLKTWKRNVTATSNGAASQAWENALNSWKAESLGEFFECIPVRRLAEDTIALEKAPTFVEFSVQLDTKITEILRASPASDIRKLDVPLSEIPSIGALPVNPNVLLHGEQSGARVSLVDVLPEEVRNRAPRVAATMGFAKVEAGKASRFPLLYDDLLAARPRSKSLHRSNKFSPSVAELIKQTWADEDTTNWTTLDYLAHEQRIGAPVPPNKPRFRSARPPASSPRSPQSVSGRLSPVLLGLWEQASDSARTSTWAKGCAADCAVQYAKFGPAPTTPSRIAGLAKTSALNGQLDDNMRAALAFVVQMDATRANLEIAKKYSETILTHPPIISTVQTLVARFRTFVNWAHTKLPRYFHDDNLGNWHGNNPFYYLFPKHSRNSPSYVSPYDKSGTTDKNNKNLTKMVWTGETGPLLNEYFYQVIENGGNTREMLSLLYRTLYNRGQHGHGFLDILYRTMLQWEQASRVSPVLAQTVFQELLALGVNLTYVSTYNRERYQDICFPDAVSPNWGENALEMPPRGWGFLKYQCSAVDAGGNFQGPMHHFLAAPAPETKLVEFSYSTRIRPPLTFREIDWLFQNWNIADTRQKIGGDVRSFVQYEGQFVPWRSGGDVLLSHAKMPADHLGGTLPYSYPQWCADNLMRALGGPSKSTDLYMAPAKFFGFTKEQLYQLRAALAAWMEQGQDHSFHEVLASAEPYGLPYVAFHHANDNWDMVWHNLMVDPSEGKSYGATALLDQFKLDHPDQDCFPDSFLGIGRLNHRAMQILVNRGTEAFPLATVHTHHCRGIPSLDIQPSMLPSTDIYTHARFKLHSRTWGMQIQLLMTASAGVKTLVAEHDATTDAEYVTQSRNHLISFPSWDVATHAATAAGPANSVLLDVSGSPLGYNSYGPPGAIDHRCMEFRDLTGSPVELCSHDAELFTQFQQSVRYFKNFQSHPITFSDRQVHFYTAFSGSRVQERDKNYSPPHDHFHHWGNAKAWICNLRSSFVPTGRVLHGLHIDFLRHILNCRNPTPALDLSPGNQGRNPLNTQYSYELCVSGSIRHMTVGCSFHNAITPCPPPPITRGAYIRELAHRTAACLYTFGETIREALDPNSLANKVLTDMFIDPMSLSWAPEYTHAVVFSGFSGARPLYQYLGYQTGDTIPIGWTSFSRDVLVAWGYCHDSKVRPLNGGGALPSETPFGLLILINSPRHYARQLRNSAYIRDNQAEVLLPPAIYRVVHRRTYYSEETFDSNQQWTFDRTPGLYLEMYIEWVKPELV